MAPTQSRFRVPERILIALSDGPMTSSQIVFELDFKPSSVYNGLSTLVSTSLVERRPQSGGRDIYNLTPHGAEALDKLDRQDAERQRPNQQKVIRALQLGHSTTADIAKATSLTRVQVYTALQRLLLTGRANRSDQWGKGTRGQGITAEYVLVKDFR